MLTVDQKKTKSNKKHWNKRSHDGNSKHQQNFTLEPSDYLNPHIPPQVFILSNAELKSNSYPSDEDINIGYVRTKKADGEHIGQVFGLDCEMCLTNKNALELARVTLVNSERKVVYDQLVKPTNSIVDYLTKYLPI